MSKKTNKKVSIIILCALSVLCGCQSINHTRSQYIRDRGNDYLKSYTIAPLRVPDDLSHPLNNEDFPIPFEVPTLGNLRPVSLLPPGFGHMTKID